MNQHVGPLLSDAILGASAAEPAQLARAVSEDQMPYEVLHHRRADVLTARVRKPDGASVVVKLWNRPTVKGALRRWTGTNAGLREWRSLRRLHSHGVPVPAPLGYARLRDDACRHTEALILEDLGICTHVIERVKRHLRDGDAAATRRLAELENSLIDVTVAIIRAGIIDVDHRLENFLITHDDRLVRIDLEHGQRWRPPILRDRALGVMIGTLIGSYVFAVQPKVEIAESFAHRLAERAGGLRSRRRRCRSMRRAAAEVSIMLERQRATCGVDTRLALDW